MCLSAVVEEVDERSAHWKRAFVAEDKGKRTNDTVNRFKCDSDQEEVVSEEEDMVLPAFKPRLPRSAEKKKKKKSATQVKKELAQERKKVREME